MHFRLLTVASDFLTKFVTVKYNYIKVQKKQRNKMQPH